MSNREHKKRLGVLLILAACLRIVQFSTISMPSHDSVRFIEIAQRFQNESLTTVITSENDHPLYPLTISLIHSVLTTVGLDDGPDSWLFSGALISGLASILIIIPIYWTCALMMHPRTGFWGALTFLALPIPARILSDMLSDGLHLLLFATAMWAAIAGLRWGFRRHFLICGLCSGLAYATRPEGLALVVGAGALLVIWQILPCRLEWGFARRATALGCLGALIPVIAFILLNNGRISNERAVSRVLSLGMSQASEESVPRAAKRGRDRTLPTGIELKPRERRASREFLASVGTVMRKYIEVSGFAFPFLGLAALAAVRFKAYRWQVRPHSLFMAYLCLTLLGCFVIGLAVLDMKVGYVSTRHCLVMVLVSTPWFGGGVFVVARRLLERVQHLSISVLARRRLATMSGGVIVFTLLAVGTPVTLKPMHWHPNRVAAAEWLSQHAAGHETVLDERGSVSFSSGLKRYRGDQLNIARADHQLSYVVVEPEDLSERTTQAERMRTVVKSLGNPIARFEQRHDGAVWIYDATRRF